MTTMTLEGVEHEVRFRRVPGYFNGSTYHVDIDHTHVMTVRRISDSTWNRSAVWSAYRPGVDWSATTGAQDRQSFYLTSDRTRDLAVKAAWRKLQRTETKA